MKKLGFASKPENGDNVFIILNNGTKIEAQVVSWGAEEWDQLWAVVKTAEELIQVNLTQISAYTLSKQTPAPSKYEIVENVVDSNGRAVFDDEGERVKVARKVDVSANPNYRIVRRGVKASAASIVRSIEDGDKVVKEKDVEQSKVANLNRMDPVSQSQALVDLYKEKSRLTNESVKDHLTSKDLKETKSNYAMPSFKKHTTSET